MIETRRASSRALTVALVEAAADLAQLHEIYNIEIYNIEICITHKGLMRPLLPLHTGME